MIDTGLNQSPKTMYAYEVSYSFTCANIHATFTSDNSINDIGFSAEIIENQSGNSNMYYWLLDVFCHFRMNEGYI